MTPFGNTQHSESLFAFGLDEQGKQYLLQTTRWTKFLAIMGFIATGLMLLLGIIFCITAIANSGDTYSYGEYYGSYRRRMMMQSIGMMVTFIFVAGLYFYPIMMLLRFSNAAKRSIQEANQGLFTAAMRYQRNLYVYLGIMTIAIVGIYVLLFGTLFAMKGSRMF